MEVENTIFNAMKAHAIAHHTNWRAFDLETGMPAWKTRQAGAMYNALCDDIDDHNPPTIREIVAAAFKTEKKPSGMYLLSGAIKRN